MPGPRRADSFPTAGGSRRTGLLRVLRLRPGRDADRGVLLAVEPTCEELTTPVRARLAPSRPSPVLALSSRIASRKRQPSLKSPDVRDTWQADDSGSDPDGCDWRAVP